MRRWFMITLVGRDQAGIVAAVSARLFEAGAQLGDASMLRLGASFTIMMMAELDATPAGLQELMTPVVSRYGLHLHAVEIEAGLHQHLVPDVAVRVHGADRPGIVAQVTGALARAGLNITDLASRVGGTPQRPIYVMTVEGQAQQGIEPLRAALEEARREGIEVHLDETETLYG